MISKKMPGDKLARSKRIILIICAWYLAVVGIFYWIVGYHWSNQIIITNPVDPNISLGELSGNFVIEQPISIQSSTLDSLSLFVSTLGRKNESTFLLEILENGQEIASQAVQADLLEDGQHNIIPLDQPLTQVSGKSLMLRITMKDVPVGQGIALWYGSEVVAGKYNIEVPDQPGFSVNGVSYEGSLCMSLKGRNIAQVGVWYWTIAVALLLVIIVCFLVVYMKQKRGLGSIVLKYLDLLNQYRFLVKQLVIRDFKVKYKRSMLGILWSFLNPLLTMAVQYIVFSTIFKTNVANFPVYLLTGIVMFGYFSESVSLGMSSIVSNASLIKKVYMPKYIYPIARVMSSAINLVISLIPLLLTMILTGIPLTKALLLMPIPVFFMFLLCVGISFLLSTFMVFFRDTQFLWGVLVTLWMYFTPIFYPETIIPSYLLPMFHSNPLYQIINFVRSITLDGVTPPPINYVYCIVCSVLPLLLGIWVFKKKQDKFVLYL